MLVLWLIVLFNALQNSTAFLCATESGGYITLAQSSTNLQTIQMI